jgi:septum formation protein
VIDCDGTALAKPADRADARRMLELLSGRAHGVVTGVAVAGRLGGLPVAASVVERTEVVLRTLPDDEIDWYVATGEPEGKAGAYAIQGLGSLLVEGIEGSHQNVVGLPLTALDRLLGGFGLALRELIGR